MTNEQLTQVVLEHVKREGPISLREVEQRPPASVSQKDARVQVQKLVDSGKLRFNKDLKLVVRDA